MCGVLLLHHLDDVTLVQSFKNVTLLSFRCMVSNKMAVIIVTLFLFSNVSFFPLCLQDFLFVLCFQRLNLICLHLAWVFILVGGLDLWFDICH